VLEPLGIALVPVGLTARDVDEIHDVLQHADGPLVADEAAGALDGDGSLDRVVWADGTPDADADADAEVGVAPVAEEDLERDWALLVRLLGPVEVVDRDGHVAHVERSKTLELIAWLALHRDHSTRAGARTALWDLDVRDATFANVVSEARRAMARLVAPPDGEEWLGRTLTEVLPLHKAVLADVDLVRACLDRARVQPPELAIETLRPAVGLIRDMPFAGTGYLWPDAEGITSNLVLLATGAATELAGHCLSMGDVDGVFWATGQGLKVLPGHEELIALRMRAHARAGDLSGVRLEWETYERVLNADPWSDGEPAPKLVTLRRELLSP
jgi:two-component SAPR family response regulator